MTLIFMKMFPRDETNHFGHKNIYQYMLGDEAYQQCATDTVSVSVSADISVSVSLSVSADTDFYIGR